MLDSFFPCLTTFIASIIFSPTHDALSRLSGKRESEKGIPLAQDFLMLLNILSGLKCPF
jgi:hypothetical protein